MKKMILIVILFFLSCSGTSFADSSRNLINDDFLKNYRSNPFQWIFPEYFYKADTVDIKIKKTAPVGYKRVDFFGLTACVPEKYTHEISRKNNVITLRAKKGAYRILIIKASDSAYFYNDENHTYYYKTVEDMYHKIFTLTPKDALTIGDKWLIHSKGTIFEEVKKIQIFSSDRFMAYLKVIKDTLVKKRKFAYELTLFHANGPFNSHIIVCFPKEENPAIDNFLSTVK